MIRADVDQRTSYYDRQGKQVWRQNGVIPLRPPYSVVEKKYKPNRDYLVYYPVVEGIASAEVSREVNDKLRKLSLAEDVGSGGVSQDFSYNGDFSVSFFRKNLLVLELTGYRFPFGAAHGMPTKIYPHINLRSGRFYKLGTCSSQAADMWRSSVKLWANRSRTIHNIHMFFRIRIKELPRINPSLWIMKRCICISHLMRSLRILQVFQPSGFLMRRSWD